MANQRNKRLLSKVLIIGVSIAILGYLFHPDVGQLSIMLNGQPVAEPLTRFAAFPTFLVMMALAVVLSVLLFLGIGFFVFLAAIFITLMLCFMLAPYFWPVMLVIFLIIALMSFSHQQG